MKSRFIRPARCDGVAGSAPSFRRPSAGGQPSLTKPHALVRGGPWANNRGSVELESKAAALWVRLAPFACLVRYHKAKLVQEWVKANADKIQLVFLPAYSPEFNAVEYVWRLTRRMATHNVHFEKMADLRTKLFRRFNRFQGNPAPLRSTMKSFLAPAA